MECPYAISDSFWRAIKDLCPGKAGDHGRTALDNRLFVDAVVYVIRSGMPWRLLPEEFGNFKSVHNRYMHWARKGVWQRIFEVNSQDSDMEFLYIDSTINRAHQHSAGAKHSDKQTECIGRSSGGLSTKIHTLLDALSYPVAYQWKHKKQLIRQSAPTANQLKIPNTTESAQRISRTGASIQVPDASRQVLIQEPHRIQYGSSISEV